MKGVAMESISVIFDSNGLGIYRQLDGGENKLLHRVAISTLQQMSLADLEYYLSTNALIDMPSLRGMFADYLWTDDGEKPPRLDRDAARPRAD